MTKPIVLIGYGNPSRGDDAVGPMLLERIAGQIDLTAIELLTDFQLQIEHALDLCSRELVLFIDAAVSCRTAYGFEEVRPARDNSYSSHAMSPSAVLQVYQTVTGQTPPPAFLLSIQGLDFRLGAGLSAQANANLQAAWQFMLKLLTEPSRSDWRNTALTS